MPQKSFDGQGRCQVAFRLPAEVGAEQAFLVGDFNGWDATATPLERGDDGSFGTELELDTGRSYRYRYFLGGDRWENDWAADDYVDNEYGGADSLLVLEDGSDGATTKKASTRKPATKKAAAKKAAAKKKAAGSG